MSAPRGLTAEESAAWEKLAATVQPLHPRKPVPPIAAVVPVEKSKPKAKTPPPATPKQKALPVPLQPKPQGLDSHWDRRLKAGTLQPELTLDLHGHNLDAAYGRLMSGIAQARAMGVRTVLLVTGKSRPVEAADRAERRGAIRAKVLDWLAASSHHSAIAAVRRAHQRHGGDGALYIVLRRER
ncbi:Smr/MutS family protein [Erythrobacter mangrovi]|uniref:Smr/MutS family protein n=1 Tax=Erythrobacter mangrovi TaxID=2739433 RepID=A0A7D3XQL6_9SPHN|nr:Smr/MutS family protein [Erythrobacter mangrovi]QKG70571.1 Smr/MutS family protein [Erythrobacter mangrovi]